MKNFAIVLAALTATLLVVSVVLVFYNISLERSIKDLAEVKAKELNEMIRSGHESIREDIALRYRSEMESFAEVARNLAAIKAKSIELEEAAKKDLENKRKK